MGTTCASRVICDAPVADARNVRREGAPNGTRGRVRSPKRYVKEQNVYDVQWGILASGVRVILNFMAKHRRPLVEKHQ
jgi:hypothetical protein